MKTVTITIDNATIISEVTKIVAYEGDKAVDENKISLYDKIRIKKSDTPLLDTYVMDAVNEISLLSNEYITNLDEGSGEITIKLPDTFPTVYEDELKEEAGLYVVNNVFTMWMIHCQQEEKSKLYAAKTEVNKNKFASMLYTRNKPTLPEEH